MALKDHQIDVGQMNEEAIEGIIAGYLKYDIPSRKIVMLPKSRSLTADQKILLHLVALKGWMYLIHEGENVPPQDSSPREIETVTGLTGGTVRPRLRSLDESGLIRMSKKGRYEAISDYEEIRLQFATRNQADISKKAK